MADAAAQCAAPGPTRFQTCMNDADAETTLLQVSIHQSARSKGSDGAENVNPLKKAASELADDCTVPDDRDSCKKAIWLAELLSQLTKPTSSDPIAEVSNLTFLSSWFRNPAGPGGFFNFVDADRSGSLDASELAVHHATGLMQLIDMDGNGQASRKECHEFLRGSVVLFKKLPTLDADLSHASVPAMLADADTVTIPTVVATGPSTNPFTAAASELQQGCPDGADKASCDRAVSLAQFLENTTAQVPVNEVVRKASNNLQLWYWWQHPDGPAGLFEAVEKLHLERERMKLGSDQLSLIDVNPAIPDILRFADLDHDGVMSRAEARSYLAACAVLLQKVPMLDIAAATIPLPKLFAMADSVLKH